MSSGVSSRGKAIFLAVIVLVAVASYAAGYLTAPRPTQEKGTIVVNTWGGTYNDAAKIVADEFTRQTGWRVAYDLHAGGSQAALAKFEAEKPNYEADIYIAGEAQQIAAMLSGYTVPLSPTDVPSLGDIADSYKIMKSGQVYGVLTYVSFTTWAYRTDFVKKPIQSYDDLLDPSFKGKLGFSVPTLAPGRQLISLALWKGGDEYNIDPGFDAAKQFANSGNIGALVTSDAQMVSLLTTGQMWAVYGLSANGFQAASQGAPVALAKTWKSKNLVTGDAIGVLNTPHQDIAKKFVNLLLSSQLNGQYSATIGTSPINVKSTVDPKLALWLLSGSELANYGYKANMTYVALKVNDWNQRWEAQILPLIKS
jgi:spermidine/putrescine-binding protein